MKLSDFVVKFFQDKQINTAFTISGGGCIHLIDSLRKSSMRVVCPHHEQSALMASEGYYRMTNKMSLNIVTSGPGGTNTLTGLMGLWTDSIPSIVISGQVPTDQLSIGTGCRQIGDQEFDIIKSVKHMTKYAKLIVEADSVIDELIAAYNAAIEGRPGPVWLDIPLNIQGMNIDISKYSSIAEPLEFSKIEDGILSSFMSLLKESKKPVIVVGNGIRISNTYEQLNKFVNDSGIPVLTGPHSGVDAVDNTSKYYCGRFGILGQLSSNQIIQNADLILCLGSRLPVKMTGYNLNEFSPNSKKVVIDIDKYEIDKHKFHIDLKIVSDLTQFFDYVNSVELNLDISQWQDEVNELRKKQQYYHEKHKTLKEYASFYYLISKASKIFKNTPIVTSNGTAHVVTLQTYQLNKDQRLFTNVGCASMGYGLPASIGACIGNGNKPVICVEGDGSIMMNLQELQTIVGYNLPIKIIIVNNDGYLSIKLTQEAFFGGNEFASSRHNGVTLPSYEKIARAFSIPYYSIKTNDEIEEVLNNMMNESGSCIVEVFTHPKERHEPKVTHKGVGHDGKIIPGTLTDMFISDTF